MDSKRVAKILGVDSQYWAARQVRREQMPLLVAILFRAIGDFLEEPKPPENYRQSRSRAREIEDYRQSAFRWIFSNDDSEFNFLTMCNACGCDPIAARQKLLRIRLDGHLGAIPSADRKKMQSYRH